MKRFLVAIPVLLGLLPIGAAAQSVATAELHVSVKDPNGLPGAPCARVTAWVTGDRAHAGEQTRRGVPVSVVAAGPSAATVEVGGFATATAVGAEGYCWTGR